MKLDRLLEKSAALFGGNKAVVHQQQQITFCELFDKSAALSGKIESFDLEPGSRIALLFENSIEYVISYFAVSRAGYVLVPLDTSLAPEKLNYLLKDCEASALIVQGKFRRHLASIVENVNSLKAVICEKKFAIENSSIAFENLAEIIHSVSSDREPSGEYDQSDASNDLAAIFYTSGSTGASKGVMLSHRNLISNTLATVEYLRLVEGESVMDILPLYYIYGNSLLLTHIACGGTLIIDNRFMYPEVVMDAMEETGANGFSGVPSHFMILLNNTSLVKRKFEKLRYFTQAGGAMAPEVTRKLLDAFPDKELWIMYGQTEAAPRITYLPPEKVNEKPGSIGVEVPGVTVVIRDNEGNEVPTGQAGELTATGDMVMLGYWKNPEETAEVVKDGWLYTGDLARRDEEGYIFITGRKREIIKSGGNRVSAKEVEERILEHADVAEVAVIGIPDDILGEAIKAVVVTGNSNSTDIKSIQNHCQQTLAVHKIPKFVEFVESLPKLQSGKVDKQALKAQS